MFGPKTIPAPYRPFVGILLAIVVVSVGFELMRIAKEAILLEDSDTAAITISDAARSTAEHESAAMELSFAKIKSAPDLVTLVQSSGYLRPSEAPNEQFLNPHTRYSIVLGPVLTTAKGIRYPTVVTQDIINNAGGNDSTHIAAFYQQHPIE